MEGRFRGNGKKWRSVARRYFLAPLESLSINMDLRKRSLIGDGDLRGFGRAHTFFLEMGRAAATFFPFPPSPDIIMVIIKLDA